MTRDEFSGLVLSFLEDVAAFARRLTRSASDADDLLQETYERAFERWEDLHEARACRAWLFRIARNRELDRRRATRARPELRLVEPTDSIAPEPIVPAEVVERLAAEELEVALSSLSAEQREVILLCDLWGFEYAEIAEITRSPVGTVRSRISRGRDRLVARLAEIAREGKQERRTP
ncbi:MAG: sigma-70 family RNA polymerase sigma factor [Deltaproteobacteria bacterium]|nr:sigma-70 family RNA polymerase sigma factor [Deltaproteobacteria bacterium]